MRISDWSSDVCSYDLPILDRIITPESSIDVCVKAVCLSMDSTLRSNLSVGMPLDLAVAERGKYRFRTRPRIEADDERFAHLSQGWSAAPREGFEPLQIGIAACGESVCEDG